MREVRLVSTVNSFRCEPCSKYLPSLPFFPGTGLGDSVMLFGWMCEKDEANVNCVLSCMSSLLPAQRKDVRAPAWTTSHISLFLVGYSGSGRGKREMNAMTDANVQ